MRKKKLGFTLAETATAMGIVGIIAAIVVPMLVTSAEARKSGATLGRLVEQVSLGNQNLMQFANSRRTDGSFSETLSTVSLKDLNLGASDISSVLPQQFKSIIPPYWGLNNAQIAPSSILSVKNASGSGNDSTVNSGIMNSTCYNFAKQSSAVCISGKATTSADPLEKTGYVLYFDVNGLSTQPNRVGKDIFGFDLLNNGQLVPTSGEIGAYTRAVVEDGYRNLGRKKS